MAATLLAVPGLDSTSPAFRAELVAMCGRLAVDPDDMATVMSFETVGTFDPAIRNPLSKAVGLIQFTKDATDALGTTRDELGQLSAVEQLVWVERYFRKNKTAGRMHNLSDTYLAVFAPVGLGKPAEFVLYRAPTKAYEQNKAFDVSQDGTITVAEAVSRVHAIKLRAQSRPRLDVPISPVSPAPAAPPPVSRADIGPIVGLAVGALILWRIYSWHKTARLVVANGL